MEPDYYEILGVQPTTDIAIIKAQYRRLVRENHPDIAIDKATAHAKIQQINAAWTILSNQTRRAAYDERRSRSVHEPARAEPKPPPRSHNSRTIDAKAEARKRARVRQVMSGGKARHDDNPRTRLLAMFLEAAQLYNVEGRSEDAVRVYQNILRADPTNAEAAIRIGDIYAEQKRRDVALAMYERAVRLQPANAEYRRKYNSLRHPENVVAPAQRGGNPWRRDDSESPLSDRIARKNPDVPLTRTVFDNEIAANGDNPLHDTGNEQPNETEQPERAVEEINSSEGARISVMKAEIPVDEHASSSFLQRFRARLKR